METWTSMNPTQLAAAMLSRLLVTPWIVLSHAALGELRSGAGALAVPPCHTARLPLRMRMGLVCEPPYYPKVAANGVMAHYETERCWFLAIEKLFNASVVPSLFLVPSTP